MEHIKEDRRLRRTRQLLRDTLLTLLKEKEYEAITVQDIIEKADIARSTFYAHYLDKDDLLLGRSGIFAGDVAQRAHHESQANHKGETFVSARGWFDHLQAQKEILKAIGKNSAMDLAMHNLYEIVREETQNGIRQHLPDDEKSSLPSSLVVDYLAGTLITLIKWWVKHDMTRTPEEMDEMFQRLVMKGISSMSPRVRG